jgi:hypothetical protein
VELPVSAAKRAAKAVAVASIHEEDFSLEDLSVEELEKLQSKIEVQLAKKLQEYLVEVADRAEQDRLVAHMEKVWAPVEIEVDDEHRRKTWPNVFPPVPV